MVILFSYDNFITDEKMFRETTGLEVEKLNNLYEYLDPRENCEDIKYHESAKIRKNIGQMFRLHQAFHHPHQNQSLRFSLCSQINSCEFLVSDRKVEVVHFLTIFFSILAIFLVAKAACVIHKQMSICWTKLKFFVDFVSNSLFTLQVENILWKIKGEMV